MENIILQSITSSPFIAESLFFSFNGLLFLTFQNLTHLFISIFILVLLLYILKKNYAINIRSLLFDRIISESPDLIFTLNRSGKIIFFNHSFLENLGYTRQEILKMHISEIMVSSSHIMNHLIDHENNEDKINAIEFILRDKSETELLFQANISFFVQKKGDACYTFIARNITDQKKILNALIDSEEKFKAIAENTSAAIFLLSELNIIYANPSVTKVLGFPEKELFGKSFLDLLLPVYRSMVLDRYKKRLKGDYSRNLFQVFLLPKKENAKQFEISINVFQYKQKTAEVIIARDITEKALLEQQLFQAEKLASLGQLVTGISHELNNKLQPIFIYCQLLKTNDFPNKIASQLEGIESSANSAKIILEALLKFGRPGQMMKEKCSINEVVRETLTLVDYKLKPENIILKTSLDENLPLSSFDKNQISQVVLNILNNAIYASEDSKSELTIKTYTDGKMLILSMADNGPGIPPGQLDKIFDPFFTTKPVGKGTGLGLSISYSIIKAHNGRIYASNKREGGAVFVIELPILGK
ncbi:MAG: PAS domain S-box protein [Candidatus Aureabacteria bacterium]|nr:PAS domain S-box protein [Candidatus Auribacterota bacterium]